MTPCLSHEPSLNATSPEDRNPSTPATPLIIRIRNQGHICSFKNTKKIVRRRLKDGQLGTPLIITDPDKKQKMRGYTRDFESALSSTLATISGATQTAPFPPSLIAQLMPLDDSLDWIPESDGWRTLRVAKGEEGVDVIFERLPDTGQLLL